MEDREIRIDNLTKEQIEMLDMMWNIGDPEEFNEWYDNLSYEEAQMANSLKLLLFMAILESAADEQVMDLSLAKNYLKKFQLKK